MSMIYFPTIHFPIYIKLKTHFHKNSKHNNQEKKKRKKKKQFWTKEKKYWKPVGEWARVPWFSRVGLSLNRQGCTAERRFESLRGLGTEARSWREAIEVERRGTRSFSGRYQHNYLSIGLVVGSLVSIILFLSVFSQLWFQRIFFFFG